MLLVNDRVIATTEAGFLTDANHWDARVADTLALQLDIRLDEAHWEIIYFLRDYYGKFNHLPNARMFVKLMKKQFGDEKGSSIYLHRLFPGSAVRCACLIAGLPKPPGCL